MKAGKLIYIALWFSKGYTVYFSNKNIIYLVLVS